MKSRVARSILVAGLVLLSGAVAAAAPSPAPSPCKAAGTERVGIELKTPPGVTISGLKVLLGYPRAKVALPGSADDPSVKQRFQGAPPGFMHMINDTDDAVRLSLVSAAETLKTGRIFMIEFDRCVGAPAPAARDFSCKVEEAASASAALVDSVTCVAALERQNTEDRE